jgi:iron(III) transport system substrate-binding protein
MALATLRVAWAEDAQRTLRVYTALSEQHQKRYGAAFAAAYPGLTLTWHRESTGTLTSRLLEEKDAPQADVIFGLAATSMEQLRRVGVLEPFAPAGVERLKLPFRDPAEPPAWVGMNAWIAAVCVNTVELAARNLPAPVSWRELTGLHYRKLIAMPSPVTSGTGFLNVSAWIQLMGEEAAWAFMDRLHKNVHTYTPGGEAPCTMASRGEVAMGISFAHRGVLSLRQGAPVQILLPREGVGWDVGAAAVIAGSGNPEGARKLVTWAISEEANALYKEAYAFVGVQDTGKPVAGLPDGIYSAMIQNDLNWAADNRSRIIETWRERYITVPAKD